MEDKLLEHCKRLEQKLLSLEYENKRLNKALDKACTKLEHFDGYMNPEDVWTDKEWKAWCLDENT